MWCQAAKPPVSGILWMPAAEPDTGGTKQMDGWKDTVLRELFFKIGYVLKVNQLKQWFCYSCCLILHTDVICWWWCKFILFLFFIFFIYTYILYILYSLYYSLYYIFFLIYMYLFFNMFLRGSLFFFFLRFPFQGSPQRIILLYLPLSSLQLPPCPL